MARTPQACRSRSATAAALPCNSAVHVAAREAAARDRFRLKAMASGAPAVPRQTLEIVETGHIAAVHNGASPLRARST